MSVFIFPPTASLLRIAPFGYSVDEMVPLFAMYGWLISKVICYGTFALFLE